MRRAEARLAAQHVPYLARRWRVHPEPNACEPTLVGHSDGVTALALTPDSRYALTRTEDGSFKLYDLESRSKFDRVSRVIVLVVGPDGELTISVGECCTFSWRLRNDQRFRAIMVPIGPAPVVVARNGQYIISSDGRDLLIWDANRPELWFRLQAHEGTVTSLAVTPDSRYVLSASQDQVLKVWDAGQGLALHTLRGHAGRVTSIRVTPDGRCAVSASTDRTLKVWDLSTGRAIAGLHADSELLACAIVPDGTIARGEQSGGVQALRLVEPGAGAAA